MRHVFLDVDVQQDFCEPDGALWVPAAPNHQFRALVAHALDRGHPILGSVDTHAYDAWEFASSGRTGPSGETPRFPDHCVKGTPGWLKVQGTLPQRSRFVPNVEGLGMGTWVAELLDRRTQALYFEKEVYSLFANPVAAPLVQALLALETVKFWMFGVATDYCVKAAALGLAERGCHVTVLTDAVAGITAAGAEAALAAMAAAGVSFSSCAEALRAT
jgi:nicotinamidase/pyrazinamidase